MKARDFCYWLMGALEAGRVETMDEAQVAEVRSHLNMVFIHDIDPTFPAKQQEALDAAHRGESRTPPSASLPLSDHPSDILMKC